MRICPVCGNKRKSEVDTVTMHICEKDYEKIVEKHGGINLAARDEIVSWYRVYGLEHAGALPNKIKENEPQHNRRK